MSLLRLLSFLSLLLVLAEAGRLVKRDPVLTDEAELASKYANAAEKFGEVTDALFGPDSPFKKLKDLSKTLSNLAGPAGIVFGIGSALIQLFGPKVPSEVEKLGEQMNSRFDKVHQELDNIKYKIDTISTRQSITMQLYKLDEKEEDYLNPLYRKYETFSTAKGNKYAEEDFRLQCRHRSPYDIVPNLAFAFAQRGQAGSASLFDDMILAGDSKQLVEAIRDRLLIDFTRAVMMIPLCAPVRGWNRNWIKNRMDASTKGMKEAMETINMKIHNAFYRDSYKLKFCILKAAPYNPENFNQYGQQVGELNCNDGFYNNRCEFRFSLSSQYQVGGSGWQPFGKPVSRTIRKVQTDGKNALSAPLCMTEQGITYDKDPVLYQAIWMGGRVLKYQINVDEMDDDEVGDVVIKQKSGEDTGNFFVTINNSRSVLSSTLYTNGDVYGKKKLKWACETDEDMCKTIEFSWTLQRFIYTKKPE